MKGYRLYREILPPTYGNSLVRCLFVSYGCTPLRPIVPIYPPEAAPLATKSLKQPHHISEFYGQMFVRLIRMHPPLRPTVPTYPPEATPRHSQVTYLMKLLTLLHLQQELDTTKSHF